MSNTNIQTIQVRVGRLLARVRRKQLELAIQGNVRASARYAQRAHTIRRKAPVVAAMDTGATAG